MKILVLISIAMTAISSTRSSNLSEAQDITTLINDTIAKTFHSMNSVTINKLVLSMENLKPFAFETREDEGPFEHQLYFTGITVTSMKMESANLRQEFNRNRMTLFFDSLSLEMKGHLGATPNTPHVGFERSLDFENISIHVIATPLQNISKNEFHLTIDFIKYASYESNYLYSPWFHENLTPDVQYELERRIKYFLPSVFEFNLRNNENFIQTLHATFCRNPAEDILSRYPSSDIFETKNYFLIPNFTSVHRTLSNITITGMQNFESHSFASNSDLTVSTLTIKGIRGTTDLYYSDQNSVIFPLYFEVDSISITVDQKKQSIIVTAENYTVIEAETKASLTEYQSKWAMEGIQLAIASSIMPSMKFYRNSNSTNSLEEHPIVKISRKLSQQFERSTIRKMYNDWNIRIPKNFKIESCIQIGYHNYNISINVIPRTELRPYPVWIDCNFYHYLNFTFEDTSWFGDISLRSTTHIVYNINFVTDDSYMIVHKQNNTNEFELYESLVFHVKLLSKPYHFSSHELSQIEQKTRELILPRIKNLMTLFAEPLLALPLDYCTAPVKIFDDFLPFYADYEVPFRVPDENVIITQWTKSPSAWITMYGQQLINRTDETMTTHVNLDLKNAEIRMNFNDSLKPFDEQHIALTKLRIRNYTDEGEVAVWFPEGYVSLDNKTTSQEEIRYCIDDKLQPILYECFNNLA